MAYGRLLARRGALGDAVASTKRRNNARSLP
jgi:chorismate mutase